MFSSEITSVIFTFAPAFITGAFALLL